MTKTASHPIERERLPQEAWRPVEAEEGRSSPRVSERELALIGAFASFPDPGKAGEAAKIPARLWDLSQHGFSLLVDKERVPAGIGAGSRACVSLDLGGGLLTAECAVKQIIPFRGQLRLGLARRDLARRRMHETAATAPRGEYLLIPERHGIRAEASNPIFFGETSSLRLCGLRPGPELEFVSSDPSLPLFRGQELRFSLVLPSAGENHCSGAIENLELFPGGAIRLRVRPDALPAGLANELSAMLVFDMNVDPATLRRLGFPARVFRDRIRFEFVETMAEYEQALNLRRDAYAGAGKGDAGAPPESMSFAWDRRSRILVAFHDGKMVASVALTFPDDQSPPLRSESLFPGRRFPVEVPRRSTLMEISALCTHPDYRRSDLLRALFEQIARVFALSDRDRIVTLSEDGLLPLYLGIGFRKAGAACEYLGRPHHLIWLEKDSIIRAKNLGWLSWNAFFGGMMRDLIDKGLYRPRGVFESGMLRLLFALRPLSAWRSEWERKREFESLKAISEKGGL